MYGADKDPVPVTLDHNELLKHLEHEAFYSHILNLQVGGQTQQVVLKDLQRHPAKAQLLHMDLQRIDKTHKLHMHVPLHFINENICPGRKAGGVISHNTVEVEVSCLAKDLPEFIEVDLSELHTGQAIHVSELQLPEGVRVITHGEQDQPVVSVHRGRGGEEEYGAEGAGEEGAEGEV